MSASVIAGHPTPHPYLWSAVLPACILESCFYLTSLFEHTRSKIASLQSPLLQGFALWISSLIPYCVLSVDSHTFAVERCGLLALWTAIAAFWYVLFPKRRISDVGFLVVIATPVVAKLFARIYLSPEPHLRLDILGSLMWIRIALVVLLAIRGWNPGPWGLWPQREEWRQGLICFALSIVPVAGLAILIGDVRFLVPSAPWHAVLLFCGTFIGFFWVSGLAEELYFRGVIERAFFLGTRSWPAAILASALIFGLAHLWYHAFPNWRRAVTASCLGLSCGICYAQTGSARTSLVTHSMVVAVLKTFFTV